MQQTLIHRRPQGSHTCVKIVVLGDAGVGKTALLHRLVHGGFKEDGYYRANIGSDLLMKQLSLEDEAEVVLQLWDTAGQERFRSLNRAYFRGADGCAMVFDLTRAASFASLTLWCDEFRAESVSATTPPPPLLLLGNKADLPTGLRAVSNRYIGAWCEEQLPSSCGEYFECSAKTGINVEAAFRHLAAACLARRRSLRISSATAAALRLGSEGPGSSDGCLCR